VDYTDQGRRAIKDSPDRAAASKAEAAKLGVQVKDLFYTPGGPHDAAIVIEAEGQLATVDECRMHARADWSTNCREETNGSTRSNPMATVVLLAEKGVIGRLAVSRTAF
jgi:uncharacterized protein with GYD domain